jgi:hypothetical protein
MKNIGIILLALLLFSFTGKQPSGVVILSCEDLTHSHITFSVIKPHGLLMSRIQIKLNTQVFIIEGQSWRKSHKMDELTFEIPLRKDQHLLSPTITFYSGKKTSRTMRVQKDFVDSTNQLCCTYK